MSQQSPRLANLFKLEYPQSVGIFSTYEEAQKAVDHLSDARFPVENLAIVGTDLRSIERVLGRRTWGTVIGQGVQSGLSTGLMVAFLMWLFVPGANFLVLLLSALGIGILIGIAFAALGYWMSQGKRDFTSVSQTIATRYELLSEHKVASQAKELLAQLPGARAAQFDPRTPPAGYPQQPAAYPPPSGYPQPQVAYPAAPPQPGYGYPPPPAPYQPSGGFYPPSAPAPEQPAAPSSGATPADSDDTRPKQ